MAIVEAIADRVTVLHEGAPIFSSQMVEAICQGASNNNWLLQERSQHARHCWCSMNRPKAYSPPLSRQ